MPHTGHPKQFKMTPWNKKPRYTLPREKSARIQYQYEKRETSISKCYEALSNSFTWTVTGAGTEYVNTKTVGKQTAVGLRDWFYFSPRGFILSVPGDCVYMRPQSLFRFFSTHPVPAIGQDEFQTRRKIIRGFTRRSRQPPVCSVIMPFPFTRILFFLDAIFTADTFRSVNGMQDYTDISSAITRKLAIMS